jgi:hypothetical protein
MLVNIEPFEMIMSEAKYFKILHVFQKRDNYLLDSYLIPTSSNEAQELCTLGPTCDEASVYLFYFL